MDTSQRALTCPPIFKPAEQPWYREPEAAAVTLLEVEELSVRYGAALALDRISMSLAAGERVGLLGANGAGKTTLLRAVSGLIGFHSGTVTSGAIRLDGNVVSGDSPSRMIRRGLAQCLEGRRIFGDLTVAENLRIGSFSQRDRVATKARTEAVLEWFPRLAGRLSQKGGLLSGGEQQMLAIGRALMARPRLLLLDEPSLGLAPIVVAQIGDILERVSVEEGVAILLVEQSTSLVLRLTQRAYLVETGRVRTAGVTSEMLADGDVRAAYLGTQAESAQLASELPS
jgi:ABC-type branched-subunit amino acid transport system ATPase component